MVTVPLHKMSAPCSNELHCPFPHVQHCPPHHGRVNLPDDVGLQLVEGGRIWIWDSPIGRSRGGRKWQTLDMDGTHSTFMEELSKFMEEHSIFMEGHSKVTPKSRQQSVSTRYQAFFFTFRFVASQGFVKNSIWISHQPELYLSQLILTKLTFFSCPADSSIGDLVTHSLTHWVSK